MNNDIKIWHKVKNGDNGSIKKLYNLHIGSLYTYNKLTHINRYIVKDKIHNLFGYIFVNPKSTNIEKSV